MSLGEFEIPTFDNSVIRLDQPSQYLIKKAKYKSDGYESLKKSMESCTLYIGKLSTDTTEEQLYELFSKCGIIKQIIMGLDRFKNIPCGFCFIIYQDLKSALSAMKYLNHTMLDGSKIEIDLDPGFVEGRQFGRGVDGGQFKKDQFAPRGGRGGYRGGYRGGRGNFRYSRDSRYNNNNGDYPQRGGFERNAYQDRRTDSYTPGGGDHYLPPRGLEPISGTLPTPEMMENIMRPPQQQQQRRILEPKSGTLPSRPREVQREPKQELPPHMLNNDDDDDDMRDVNDDDDDELPPHLR